MTELDERTLTPMVVATPRYDGDLTLYAPDLMTPAGFHIGRSLPGLATSTAIHSGALQLFIGHDQNIADCEALMRRYCDHAQIHPATMYAHNRATVGRGYWVRAGLTDLMELCALTQRVVAMPPVLMVPPAGYVSPQAHGRVVVPFDGTIGTPIVDAAGLSWLRRTLSANGTRAVVQHLDFNGVHMGTSGIEADIEQSLAVVCARYDTTILHDTGMTRFSSSHINVECYPVVIL